MKKQDVDFHRIGYGSRTLPAINVKVYRLGVDADVIAEKFGCSEEDAQKALELAFDVQQQMFWDDVQQTADYCFGDGTKVYSEGRSSGWLVVEGLGDIEEWDAIALGKWAKFVKAIKQSVEYCTSGEALIETIDSNEYYKHGAEQYNFVEHKDGSTACIADLKREAIEKGYGPVVRG